MDLVKLSKNIKSLTQYVELTEKVCKESNFTKIQFNMSAVLALKNIKTFEIQYFNKYKKNGVACNIFQMMLDLPPTKTWHILGKELVLMVQFWLDALRTQIVAKNPNWWIFLKLLLKFIGELCGKHPSLPDALVEHLAEILLDLAVEERSDVWQRYEILYYFNLYCSESSRNIRFVMRNKFAGHFIKLSAYMSTCGHFPCQFSILEALIRWLVPRNDSVLRSLTAYKWFSKNMYTEEAVNLFLDRQWLNFYQDSRDFLNVQNGSSEFIVSFLFKKLTIGSFVVIPQSETYEAWLDVNKHTKCVTVILYPRTLWKQRRSGQSNYETLVVREENTEKAALLRGCKEILLTIKTQMPLLVEPSGMKIVNEEIFDLAFALSPRIDYVKLDAALKSVFLDKYQVQFDLNTEFSLTTEKDSRETHSQQNVSETVQERFSQPAETVKRKKFGFTSTRKNSVICQTPSSVSTSSLKCLPEKLASITRNAFDKQRIKVWAEPDLSTVSEGIECDENFFNTTNSCNLGVCYRKKLNKKSQSDTASKQVLIPNGYSSPNKNTYETSCLLAVTVGSTDENVIKESIERVSKNRSSDSNQIIDLLIQEALCKTTEGSCDSSSVITDKKKVREQRVEKAFNNNSNRDVMENTPAVEFKNEVKKGIKTCTIISNTESDESNTEAFEMTNFVNVKKRRLHTKKIVEKNTEEPVFVKQVEKKSLFNSKLMNNNNKHKEMDINPSSANKNKNSDSESMRDCDKLIDVVSNKNLIVVNKIDTQDCVNDLIDKVCKEDNKNQTLIYEDITKTKETSLMKDNFRLRVSTEKSSGYPKTNVSQENIKIKRTQKKVRAPRKSNKIIKNSNDIVTNVAVNPKDLNDISAAKNFESKTNVNSCANVNAITTVDINLEEFKNTNTAKTSEGKIVKRKKRKLYSEKNLPTSENETNTINKSSKPRTSFYEEISNERRKAICAPRRKRTRDKSQSPNTIKNNQKFDELKQNVENPESILYVNKTERYNIFNNISSSEDDDFQIKPYSMRSRRKNSSSTTIASDTFVSSKKKKLQKEITDSEKVASTDDGLKNRLTSKRKNNNKRSRIVQKQIKKQVDDLIDERMRSATSNVNDTSIIIEHMEIEDVDKEPSVALKAPEIKITEITDALGETMQQRTLNSKKVKKTKCPVSLEKGKVYIDPNKLDIEGTNSDRTESPLPGLVVEFKSCPKTDANDSILENLFKKIKRSQQEGISIDDTNTTQGLLQENYDCDNEVNNKSNENLSKMDQLKNKSTTNIKGLLNVELVNDNLTQADKIRGKISVKKDNNVEYSTEKKINQTKDVPKTRKYNQTENQHEIDLESEHSIDSIYIRAHGDSDEDPPRISSIRQCLIPRDLEIEDFDITMKDFFKDLQNVNTVNNPQSEVRVTTENFNKNDDEVNDLQKHIKTPKVLLNSDDVSKWFSRKNSSHSSAISFTDGNDDITKWLGSRRSSITNASIESPIKIISCSSQISKSPVVSIKRITLEDLKKSPFVINSSDEKWTNILKTENVNIAKDKAVKLSKNTGAATESEARKSQQKVSIEKIRNNHQHKELNNEEDLRDMKNPSTTSPIRIFDKISPDIEVLTPEHNQQDSDSENDCLTKIRDIYRKDTCVNSRKSISTNKEVMLSEKSKSKFNEDRHNISISNKMQMSSRLSTLEDPMSRSLNVKEKIAVPTESVPSLSSVCDWLQRNENIREIPECGTRIKDILETVKEKLDTTIVEIHQQTTTMLAHMFVNMQEKLRVLKESKIKDMESLVKKWEDADNSFIETMKTHCLNVMKEDSKMKNAMVLLLKEDLQAVTDYIERQGL